MMTGATRPAAALPVSQVLQLAAALTLLNGSLTFVNVWPTPRVRWDWALSIELAALVLVLTAIPRYAASLARFALPTLWVALVCARYADVTGPGLYGREFNLYWDSAHIGNVVAMLARAVPAWIVGVAAVAAALALTLLWLGARAAWTCVASAVAHTGTRRALAGVSAALAALFLIQPPRDPGLSTPVPFADPVSRAVARQGRYVLATATPAMAPGRDGQGPLADGPLAALAGADVVLAFVEAYGAVTYDNPAFATALTGPRADLAAAARDTGRGIVSARIESPTFGASSWLAHLTLLTGVEVSDQYAYVGLMASRHDTLPRAFRRHGYRSVAMMPGMRQAWPEGAFYGFDRIYGRDELEYSGPRFGWWSIPDQFTLARLDELELDQEARPPRFVVFPTSTTHAPFGPVAPYQPDWTRLLTEAPFDDGAVAESLATMPDLTNLAPSYVRATAYALNTFAGWVRRHGGDRMILILVGDHQPVAAVSGPGASRDVPVHVIAPAGPILDRLRAAGFVEGVGVDRRALMKMHALVPTLLGAFR